jgi:hypothetical protein
MRKLIVIFGLTLFCYSFAAESRVQKNIQDNIQSTMPDANVAIKFMDDYITYCDEFSRKVELIDWINSRQDVTVQFKKELGRIITEAKRTSPELGLGFDPIFDAQDYPDKFEVDRTDSDYIVVKGADWPDFKVVVRLRFEENKWLVAGAGIVNIPKDKQRKK